MKYKVEKSMSTWQSLIVAIVALTSRVCSHYFWIGLVNPFGVDSLYEYFQTVCGIEWEGGG